MNPIRTAVEAGAFRTLLATSNVLPRAAIARLGGAAGALVGRIDRRHSAIALQNLRAAFGPVLGDDGALRILRACWRHFGRITLELLAARGLRPGDVGRMARVEGLEHLRHAQAAGRGVLQFTGHIGNWELGALLQAMLGFPMTVVARPLDNRRLERMLAELRTSTGNRLVHKRRAARELLATLADGGTVAMLIDQDAREAGLFVPFFGRLASTTPALATLALRTGATVLPVCCLPEQDGRYRMIYEPPLTVERTGRRDEDALRLTAACTARIEAWVRAEPHLWLWMHRRWKTRPPAERADT